MNKLLIFGLVVLIIIGFVMYKTGFDNISRGLQNQVRLYYLVFLSMIFGFLLVFISSRKINPVSMIVMLIISLIFYIVMSNSRGSGLEMSVPSVGYPVPPHLGLDGVSIENQYL